MRSLPAAPGLVLTAISPGRCRVWHDGAARDVAARDTVRRLFPDGLLAGDRAWLRDGQVAEVAARQSVLVSRDADTMAEAAVAANLTRLLIVLSCRRPDFHATVLAHHLLYAGRQNVTPIICLTKGDLVPDRDAAGWLAPFRSNGYAAVVVSAVRGRGLAALKALLAGQMTAVIGHPGAGKSTLLAALAGEQAEPGPASEPGRGRHGEARMLCLAPDAWLLDLPGLRELSVWKPDLTGAFREFGPYAGLCSRPGCLHRQEPGCAVRQAAAQGQVPQRRYQQYLQLLHHLGIG